MPPKERHVGLSMYALIAREETGRLWSVSEKPLRWYSPGSERLHAHQRGGCFYWNPGLIHCPPVLVAKKPFE